MILPEWLKANNYTYVRRLRLPRQKVQDDWSVHTQSFRDAMEREGIPVAPMSQWLRP